MSSSSTLRWYREITYFCASQPRCCLIVIFQNYRIWVYTSAATQIRLLQGIRAACVQRIPLFFRHEFGIRSLIDILRMFLWVDPWDPRILRLVTFFSIYIIRALTSATDDVTLLG